MKLSVTPLQRFNLRNLAYSDKAPKVKGGQEGRRFRRFCRHLGLDVILEAAVAGNGKVRVKQINDRTPALFDLEEEDRDRILALMELERDPAVEDVLGPLFDTCEDWKAGRELPSTEGVSDYDPARENWKVETVPKDEDDEE